jgi:rubrerythrin
MPHLRSEPAGVVGSLNELFALAHAMESEAVARYSDYATSMRAQKQDDLADMFESIAQEERGHLASVDAWSEQRFGRKPDPDILRWRAPPTFDEDDAAEMAGSHLLTPYRVLTVATRNEERAFTFWSYVAAHAQSDEVRQAAETMAKEELAHVAAFRRERRKAFHAGRRPGGATPSPQWAADLELKLACLLDDMAAADPNSGALREMAATSRAMANQVRTHQLQAICPPDAAADMVAEALAEAYLQGADARPGRDDYDHMQNLAQAAVRRLSTLRDGPAAAIRGR